jgi:hypothetical protein
MATSKASPFQVAVFLASIPARLYALCMGAIFIFGQMFVNHYTVAATIAGVCGLMAAVLPIFGNEHAKRVAAIVCFASVAGVAGDAFNYYANLAINGNYYGWALIGPFALATAFLGARHVASFSDGNRALVGK